MREVWKDIKGYEGLYQISNYGRVKSFNCEVNCYPNAKRIIKGRIRKAPIDKDGYYRIGLSKDHKQKHYYVHRLVAEAFLPNPNNYKSINHKDENKKNNRADNLEWCTIRYNNLYNNKIDKLTKSKYKKVIQYDVDMQLIAVYESIKQASSETGIKRAVIARACRGIKTKCGYNWRFANA